MGNNVVENENKKTDNNDNKFEEVEVFQEVEPIKKEIRTDSYFDGGLIELIGWNILSFLISVITLGIGAPWGKCMLYSYQMKHTVYNGKRLKFEGTGGDLFVNMFKWILLTIITFGIYAFFIPVRKTKWVISNIHFEDEDFVRNESFFDGKTIQLIGINLLCSILNTISFGLLCPFTICLKMKWINKHTVINKKKIAFSGKALSLFGKYILWCFLTIITFGIYGLWLPIKMLKWQTKNTHIKVVGETEQKDKSLLIAIPIIIICIILVSLIIPNVIGKGKAIDLNNIEGFESFGESINDFGSSVFDGKSYKSSVSVIPSESTLETVEQGGYLNPVVTTNNKNTKKGKYPTAKEIEGKYNCSIEKKQLINGMYDESKTKKTSGTVNFKYVNGELKYNDSFKMNYDSNLGYAFYISDSITAEAYFNYIGDEIKVEMLSSEDNYTKETKIIGTK